MNIGNLLNGDHFGMGPKLGRFLAWWGGELRALAPAWLERRLSGEETEVRARVLDRRVILTLNQDGGSAPLGELDLADDLRAVRTTALREVIDKRVAGGTGLRIELDGGQVLGRDVFLPLATEHNLAQVIRFEMDRLTPFTGDQVGFSYRILARLPERDRIKVRLEVVPRDYLLGLLEQLAPLGLTVSGVYIADALAEGADEGTDSHGNKPSFNVLPADLQAPPEALWNGKNRKLLAGLLALLVLAIGLPAYWQNRQLGQLETEIPAISADATRAAERQRLLAAHLEGQRILTEKKNTQLAKLETLRALTELLPGTTWVSKLEIDRSQVSLQGESSKSSDLIAILEQSEYFRNVEFASPVTRGRASDKEQYQIRMQLVGLEGGE